MRRHGNLTPRGRRRPAGLHPVRCLTRAASPSPGPTRRPIPPSQARHPWPARSSATARRALPDGTPPGRPGSAAQNGTKAIPSGGYAGRKVGVMPGRYKGVAVIGAILLGLFCGIVARMLVPGDAFRNMSGPKSWLISLGLGLLGALVGYLIFTVGLGIGDTDIFDWGGLLSALIGTVIVLVIFTWVMRRRARTSS